MELKTDTFANNKILRASNELSFQQNNLTLDVVLMLQIFNKIKWWRRMITQRLQSTIDVISKF